MTPTLSASLTQIRNATLRIDYGGIRFLVDPMLAECESSPGFPGSVDSERRNPLVALPLPIETIVDVDAVILTHLHVDHWDQAAIASIDKNLPIFVQNEEDALKVQGQGFTDLRLLTENSEFKGVRLIRTDGQHGTDETVKARPALGKVSGVVFAKEALKRLYIAGDTLWNHHVADAITRHRPDVIVLNAGKATFIGMPPIIMGEEDVLAVHRAAPQARLVASHMEAVNHCTLSRADLQAYARKHGFASHLATPADGETLVF